MSQIATVPLPAKPAARESNVKETIEQILVAFILAFVFRCFIVEAFVIPTGSMATTLLGAHMDFRCPDCGWHWNVNYSGDDIGDDVRIDDPAKEIYAVRCPNCGFKLPRTLANDPDNDASFPRVQYGDRILVQKYAALLRDPSRWDVVVFKNPDTSRVGPNDDRYTVNYIKRLVGLPGETLMVLDGDIYVSKADKPVDALTPDDFTVQTKPYKAQESLWRIVYDNDHPPRGLPRVYPVSEPTQYNQNPPVREEPVWQQPWKAAGDGWTLSDVRRFRFIGTERATISFDPTVTPQKHSLTDWLGYGMTHNVNAYTRSRKDFFNDESSPVPPSNLSDVKLALTYRREGGVGPFSMRLTKQEHAFVAEFTPGTVRLLMSKPNELTPTEIAKASTFNDSGPHRIELINVDYRVSVLVDGKEVLATTPEQFKPNVSALLDDYEKGIQQAAATVSISAQDQQAELSHVSLWRDVFYLNVDSHNSVVNNFWAMPDNFPHGDGARRLIRLNADEYFTMGDNSAMSADARCWQTPVALKYENLAVDSGRVPKRFMLGRAFFVYWPAGYSPGYGLPGFVPNFGEMRFIH